MPEGHTIHRLARDHKKWFAGSKVALLSPQGRFTNESKQLSGRKLTNVSARGKHLFYHFGQKHLVHVHLGLYGKFRIHKNPAPEPRGAVRVRLIGNERTFDLNGPNRCELLDNKQRNAIITLLGEDPLDENANPDQVWNKVSKSRSAIGTLLLNQSIIAGIGNVYRAEIMFLLGIHPETSANQLSRELFDRLWNLTVKLMKVGVKYNRIITVDRSGVDRPFNRLKSSERLNIYKKQNCPTCTAPVETWEQANRKIYACPSCQPACL